MAGILCYPKVRRTKGGPSTFEAGLGNGSRLGYLNAVLWAVVKRHERERPDFEALDERVDDRRERICRRLAAFCATDPVIQRILREEEDDRYN